jgi:mevalonate kinase
LIDVLPKLEAWYKEQLNGADYLGGTNEPMMIDIHAFVYGERLLLTENSVWHDNWLKLDFKNLCPTVVAHTERFRNHPAFSKHVVITEAFHSQIKLQDANPPGVKA